MPEVSALPDEDVKPEPKKEEKAEPKKEPVKKPEKKKRRRILSPDEAFTFNDLPKEEKTIEDFDFKHDDRNIETASDEELDKWLSEVLE